MELNRQSWSVADGEEFKEYLLTFSKGEEKGAWEKRIVNTNLPCIAVQSPDIKRIIANIVKGNYMQFIDLWMWDNFSLVTILGGLICKIPHFETMTSYLERYANQIDNWGNADMLNFNLSDANKVQYFNLCKQLIKSEKPFVRRIGMTILFKFVSDDNYIDKIFDILNGFYNETEYYVNMVNAWLVAECFTKQRDKTLNFINNHKLNKFTINKAISKCRDSYRISADDKQMLLSYKVK